MNEQQKEANKPNYCQNIISQELLEEIKQKYSITEQQLSQLLKQKKEEIPIHIFDNEPLGALETIVKYLKENKNLKHSRIAEKLNRSPKTIWATYQKAKQKLPQAFKEQETEITIPVTIFHNRKLSILEHIAKHLKESHNLNYTEIARLLNRSPKTIWATYQKARRKKRG